MDCHWHEEWEILRIISGSAQLMINGVQFEVNENDVILIPSECVHMAQYTYSETFIYQAIVFNANFINGTNDIVQIKHLDNIFLQENQQHLFFPFDKDNAEGKILFERIYTALTCHSPCFELLTKAYLLEFFAFVIESGSFKTQTRKPSANQIKIKEIAEFMNHNYNEQLDIEQLSKMANMSYGHFIKSFKAYLSSSPSIYLRDVRLKKAAEKLITTDEPVIRISYDSGFNNFGYFIRSFKNKFSYSPGKYRNQYKEI